MIVSGNLTRDPELRATSAGASVLTFGLAVNDRVKNQQTGEWEDRPNFFDIVVFGSRGEGLSRFLSKGSKVTVEGRLRWRSWETPEGDKRSKVEIVATDVEFMSRNDSAAGASSPAPDYDEDIPF